MKTFSIIIIALIIIACKSEKPAAEKLKPTIDSIQVVSFTPPKLEENYYRELFEYQQNITLNPASREKKQAYINKAYFPDNNTLISFGSARKKNPDTKQTIPYPLQKRAAMLDAKRWASYGLSWIYNDYQPDFGKIQAINSTETQQVYSFEKGDSLIVVLANKVR